MAPQSAELWPGVAAAVAAGWPKEGTAMRRTAVPLVVAAVVLLGAVALGRATPWPPTRSSGPGS
jgi:hypothetical protein